MGFPRGKRMIGRWRIWLVKFSPVPLVTKRTLPAAAVSGWRCKVRIPLLVDSSKIQSKRNNQKTVRRVENEEIPAPLSPPVGEPSERKQRANLNIKRLETKEKVSCPLELISAHREPISPLTGVNRKSPRISNKSRSPSCAPWPTFQRFR